MPWLEIPNLSQNIIIPRGKKAMIFITGQVLAQQTKNERQLIGVSAGIFKDNNILSSNTSQLIYNPNVAAIMTFINVPVNCSEIINAETNDITIRYTIRSRSNYGGGNAIDDLRIINDPVGRGDYSEMRISIFQF